MRYFYSNVTQVIQIRDGGHYNPGANHSPTGLWELARELGSFFECDEKEVLHELTWALKNVPDGLEWFLELTTWTPAKATALWSIVRVVLSAGFEPSVARRGFARQQAIVSDLNRGLTLLVILYRDYEGSHPDFDISKIVG